MLVVIQMSQPGNSSLAPSSDREVPPQPLIPSIRLNGSPSPVQEFYVSLHRDISLLPESASSPGATVCRASWTFVWLRHVWASPLTANFLHPFRIFPQQAWNYKQRIGLWSKWAALLSSILRTLACMIPHGSKPTWTFRQPDSIPFDLCSYSSQLVFSVFNGFDAYDQESDQPSSFLIQGHITGTGQPTGNLPLGQALSRPHSPVTGGAGECDREYHHLAFPLNQVDWTVAFAEEAGTENTVIDTAYSLFNILSSPVKFETVSILCPSLRS